ncbi:hypothetical protein NIES4072_70230 [Nostoc commune NIES-4072]|uniref:Uncharacterized protein n=1 Tax=Nostoc commune NIES-4072 TaxID=2005467 RepID=A0A2R5G5I6_NOSCO|nr:DUF1392 family protein [Nostoc commune]BBD70656.1 hypothetical protein NIES4070_70670 [Nostoc commune HK-02]GBG23311.1 hypothetical protein NIES4072_70230 [Nostoc commune NIES-4072]
MIDNINALQTSWYLSPPWRGTIPPVEVNLLERVYLRTTRTFGYCCGMQWKHECWIYSIDCGKEILHATQNQMGATRFCEVLKSGTYIACFRMRSQLKNQILLRI